MSGISAHIGGIAAVLTGEVSYTGHVAAHARAMHDASLMIDDIFPEGSGVGETRANPEIWQDWAKFEAATKTFQAATKELVEVADTGDMAAVGAQLKKVGEACGGCHKPFRKKKQ
jgi:cytochrome c556